ncbi:hypothetical protein [Actinoplanes couchii]|uniref:Uncharacterized protein n=1 Tax=Actinoplanes couchii TaxID=403638 RepID=A0ABQ3XKA7_9ACTN|nr:hypothetical protein [Actinoplanes couchii]MDR6320527.1 hypothetical protein [Actinoplanes couchii]GID58931.1 hypothetical protein Aco03nite_073350 [Actinoplanes couchii]
MDWKAALLVSITNGLVQSLVIYVRGNAMRRTVRSALRELPETTTAIAVRIHDQHGTGTEIHAVRDRPQGRED